MQHRRIAVSRLMGVFASLGAGIVVLGTSLGVLSALQAPRLAATSASSGQIIEIASLSPNWSMRQ